MINYKDKTFLIMLNVSWSPAIVRNLFRDSMLLESLWYERW